MAEQLSYPGDAAPHIIELFAREQALFREPGSPAHLPEPVPREDHLRILLDTSFFASIEKEEGRPISFRLAFIPWSEASRIKWEYFVFEKPIPFNVKQLTKLAPAIDSDASYIGVGPGEDRSLQVWGIIHFGRNPIVDLVYSEGPPCLSFIVPRAGLIMVRHGSAFFKFRYALGQAIMVTSSGRAWNDLNDLTTPLLDFASLRGIGTYMLERGHGGAVFVMPSDVGTPSCVSAAKYVAMASCDILKNRKMGTKKNWGAEGTTELHKGYRFVGSLAAVDGAVLLNSDLSVRAFGVFVNDPKRPNRAPLMLSDGNPYDIGQRGARHRSAIWFCDSDVKSALALVVSQDGGTCLFVKKDDKIIVEQDIDLHWHTF